ncbi:14042_t:CDS:2 [Entrophospora sp. SA101]|nr:14042_t:CDS:2 [Entrophospora sp. SA101]CAJ0831360.1 22570_t:CDS:2 [Entrophospora sp. SA101]CAJ0847105.1 682_t:CDS:2 [Entrophospora sp. SA101]
MPSKTKELHPYQNADILLNQEKIGFLGQIYPQQDLSLIFEENIPAGKVIEVIKKNGDPWLKKVKVFDVYQSKRDKENKQKSLAFRLTFQSQTKTLQKSEVEETVKKIISQLETSLNAKLKI